MVIYEVNLAIQPTVYQDFMLWMQGHLAEMMTLPGFMKATLYKDTEDPHKVVVHYFLRSQGDLDRYLNEYAEQLREKTEAKFPDQFEARRRVLTKESTMEA